MKDNVNSGDDIHYYYVHDTGSLLGGMEELGYWGSRGLLVRNEVEKYWRVDNVLYWWVSFGFVQNDQSLPMDIFEPFVLSTDFMFSYISDLILPRL